MSNFIPHFTPLTNKSNEKSPPHHVIRNFFCSDLASNLCTRICMFGQRKYLPSRLAQICSTNPIPIRTNETLLVNFYTKHKFAGSALISIFFQKLFFICSTPHYKQLMIFLTSNHQYTVCIHTQYVPGILNSMVLTQWWKLATDKTYHELNSQSKEG